LLAKEIGLRYLDTGAMYRALTYHIIDQGISANNEKLISKLLPSISMKVKYFDDGINIICNNRNLTSFLRDDIVSNNVSNISAIKGCRNLMVSIQRDIVGKKGYVVEGRDIGTVVFPDADFKFFLKADLKERAMRRFSQLDSKSDIDYLEKNIKYRDEYDSSRDISPLSISKDAIIIDTTQMTLKQQVKKIIRLIK